MSPAKGDPGHRLEGPGQAVRPIPTAQRSRQELPVIIAAIAREMAAFLWAISRQITPAAGI